MTLQGYKGRSLQGLIRKLQAFGTAEPITDRILSDIWVSSDDIVYLADSNNHKIARYQLDGTFIDDWGDYDPITVDGKLNKPTKVHHFNNEVYVGNANNIQVFSNTGVWNRTIASNFLFSGYTLSFYNGEFWNVEQNNTGLDIKSIFTKYDSNGTETNTFTILKYITRDVTFSNGILRAYVVSKVSGPTFNRNYLNTYSDTGSLISSIDISTMPLSEIIGSRGLTTSTTNIYSATGSVTDAHIRKHSTAGTYINRSSGLNYLNVVNRQFVHTDGNIYCIVLDGDNNIYNYVKSYNASTLALVDEWQAT
jgi:hypothetical protein